jgi:F5/8 type C domain-containing protein/fibronectin type III domain protein
MQYSSYFIKRLVLLFCLVAFYSQAGLAYDATLRWDPSADSTVVGYKLYYGTATRSYTNSISVGNQTTYTVTGLGAGTFYFAVTSQNASGVQSNFSNEVSKTLASGPPASGSLAYGATMTANSQNFAADHSVDHLWDGCLDGTPACSAGNGSAPSFWVEFDLGQKFNLSSARLFGDTDGTWTSSSWTLQYRQNTADSWTTAFSGANAFLNGWSTQPLSIAGRYVRVEVAGNTAASATQARELEIYGTVWTPSGSLLPAPTNVSVK